MEATLAYFNSKEGGGEGEDSQYQTGVLAQ